MMTLRDAKKLEARTTELELLGMSRESAVEMATAELTKSKARNKRARLNRAMREDALRSCGLVKVKGSVSGKTYWE